MARVVKKQDETVDALLKRFKRQVQRDNILIEIRKREYYLKPGIRRRVKHENALKARRKKK